jgi:hypothetical protein
VLRVQYKFILKRRKCESVARKLCYSPPHSNNMSRGSAEVLIQPLRLQGFNSTKGVNKQWLNRGIVKIETTSTLPQTAQAMKKAQAAAVVRKATAERLLAAQQVSPPEAHPVEAARARGAVPVALVKELAQALAKVRAQVKEHVPVKAAALARAVVRARVAGQVEGAVPVKAVEALRVLAAEEAVRRVAAVAAHLAEALVAAAAEARRAAALASAVLPDTAAARPVEARAQPGRAAMPGAGAAA